MESTFVSYSSVDRPLVRRLVDDLRAYGIDVWLDVESVEGKQPYWEEIQEAVENCSHFIFVVSPDSIAPACGALDELYHAKSLRPPPQFIIVVARAVDYSDMPMIISPGRYQYHDFVNNDYESMLEKILNIYGIDPQTTPGRTESQPADEPLLALKGHRSWIISVCFSPDGNRIITGSRDKTAIIWDAHTGEQLVSLIGHEGEVNSVSVSQDGSKIATAGFDQTARIWDSATGDSLTILKGHTGKVYDAVFHPLGHRVVTAGRDATARVWHVDTGKELLRLTGHEEGIDRAVFSPSGLTIATASLDGTARLWDASTGTELLRLQSHDRGVLGINFSPDGNTLATCGRDHTARLWNTNTGEELLQLRGHASSPRRVSFSPDGTVVVTASRDGTARLWSVKTGRQLREFSFLKMKGALVGEANFSPDGQRLAMAFTDLAYIWDVSQGYF